VSDNPRKGFWDFCCEHPVACVFLAFVILWGVECITQAAFDHYPPDDGFWKYNSGNNQ
jgi:hypothetical protein